jgi:RNA polymerase sigma-70 factor, ECF subfamily
MPGPAGLLRSAALAAKESNDEPIDPAVEWVRRALNGEEDAFARIVQVYSPRLNILLSRRLGCYSGEAEDVVQETFAKAFQSLDRYDTKYRFTTWLYTIGIRIAMDVLRRHRRRPIGLISSELLNDYASPALPSSMETSLAESDLWLRAQRWLSETQVTALWLRYAEEKNVAEIAMIMRKTQVGVRVLLHRARSVLIARMDSESTGTEDNLRGGHRS